jgi:hypothetical protein
MLIKSWPLQKQDPGLPSLGAEEAEQGPNPGFQHSRAERRASTEVAGISGSGKLPRLAIRELPVSCWGKVCVLQSVGNEQGAAITSLDTRCQARAGPSKVDQQDLFKRSDQHPNVIEPEDCTGARSLLQLGVRVHRFELVVAFTNIQCSMTAICFEGALSSANT